MPQAAAPDLTPAERGALRSGWGIVPASAPRRLHGGEESAAFAVGAHAVRLGPRWRPTAAAEWCHAVAAHAAARLPEAIAPLPTAGGATVVRVADRPMSVWPLVEGQWPDPADAGTPERAAAVLARLHRALADLRPPPRPVPSFFGGGLDGGAPPDDPRLQDPDLDRRLADLHRTLRHQPVHGDFHPGNTLADGGAVVAVLDWDEVSIAPPEAEVAAAALEWTGGIGDDMAAMLSFVRAYAAAGGPAGLLDRGTLVAFVRHRLRREAAYFAQAEARGTVHDSRAVRYHRRRLSSFAALKGRPAPGDPG